MAKLDFEAKTDRELLVLVAEKANETVDHLARLNNTVAKHEKRITTLEAFSTTNCEAPSKSHKTPLNWQMISALIIIVGGAMYAVCHFLGA